MKRIVLITGGFDPLHSGHIAYIKAARELGDSLIVGVNSDEWLRRKKGQEFMPWEERATIISALQDVDRVINFDDIDNSAKDAIRKKIEIKNLTCALFDTRQFTQNLENAFRLMHSRASANLPPEHFKIQ